MANDIQISSPGSSKVKTTDDGTRHTPHHNLDNLAPGVTVVSASFTPVGGATYAADDLVANSGTAGSVTPLSFTAARVADKELVITAARVAINDTAFLGSVHRIHLYQNSPTCSNGDNGAWLTTIAGYLGYIDVTIGFTFASTNYKGRGLAEGRGIIAQPTSAAQTIFGLVQTKSGVTSPGSSKTMTVELEIEQR